MYDIEATHLTNPGSGGPRTPGTTLYVRLDVLAS